MMSFFPDARLPFSPKPVLPPPTIAIFPCHDIGSAIHPITYSEVSTNLTESCRVSTTPSRNSSVPTKSPNTPSGVSDTRSTVSSSPSSPSTVIHRLEFVSLASPPTSSSSYLSLVLRIQYQPTKTHDAILLWSEATKLCYSAMGTTTLASPDGNPECTRAQHDMIDMILSKAPQYIFQDPNFDNPWYVLEIQEIRGEPRFNLALKYAYQLLISSLKDAPQLVLRNPVGLQNRHWLYERSDSHTVGKLGKLACIGYLGEGGTVNTAKFVFIKVLDLGSGLEKNGEPSIDKIIQVNGIYEEINLLNSIPGHPNIIPPPMGYIALGSEEGVEIQGRKIIGYVNQYYENGRLSDYIFLPREPGKPRTPKPITILQKAKWALQIASAMFHLHREAGLSMGDGGRGFGLERFMVDEYRQLHLGGFGGSEAVSRASWRVPPEVRVRGEWEVREEITGNRERHGIRKLAWRHNKYIRLRWEQDNLRKAMGDMDPSLTPPPSPAICGNNGTNSCTNSNIDSGSIGSNRTISKSSTDSCDSIRKSSTDSFDSYDNNNSIVEALNPIGGGDGEEGGNDRIDKSWSAFDEWHLTPKALEIVETYSLGVMLWLVFEQVLPENLPKGSEDLVITWSVDSRVPCEWRRIVEACVERNPADRIGMREVLRCFVGEVGRRWDGGWLTG